MDKSLLDTDIFSEFPKTRNPTVQRHAETYRRLHGLFTVSVVTVMEMVRGLHKAHRHAAIQALLPSLVTEEILHFDPIAAELAGKIYTDLERTGQPIGWSDTVIAAIAMRHGLELVTGNTAHYERIQRLGYPLVQVKWRL